MTTLLNYQSHHVDRLLNSGVRAVEFPYGAGKSVVALNYLQRLLDGIPFATQQRISPYAVVLCGNRNIHTWQQAVAKHAPEWAVTVGLPTDWCYTPQLCLIPHHRVHAMVDHIRSLLLGMRPVAWILDESTVAKNPKARVTQSLIAIGDHIDSLHRHAAEPRITLSGRMTPEHPQEIWSQYQFAYGARNPFGTSYYAFLRNWFIKSDYTYALMLDRRKEYHAIIAAHTLRLNEEQMVEFNNAVGVTNEEYIIQHYDETPEQRVILDPLEKHWELPPADLTDDPTNNIPVGTPIELNHIMAVLHKRRQISSGFYYPPENANVRGFSADSAIRVPSNKMTTVANLCRDAIASGQKRVVVWVVYREEIPLLENALAHIVPCIALQADVPWHLAAFATDPAHGTNKVETSAQVLIAPISMARGINDMVHARTAIFASNEYSQELRDQAEARIKRIGQRSKLVTYIDVCSPTQADIEIIRALQTKTLNPSRLNSIVREHYPCLAPTT